MKREVIFNLKPDTPTVVLRVNATRRKATILNEHLDGADIFVCMRGCLKGVEVRELKFSRLPAQGTYRLEYKNQKTLPIAYNASAEEIKRAFKIIPELSQIGVKGNYKKGFELTLIGATHPAPKINVTDSTMKTAGGSATHKIQFIRQPESGAFRLKFRHRIGKDLRETITNPFSHVITSELLQYALRLYLKDAALTVEGDFKKGFAITFGDKGPRSLTVVESSSLRRVTTDKGHATPTITQTKAGVAQADVTGIVISSGASGYLDGERVLPGESLVLQGAKAKNAFVVTCVLGNTIRVSEEM